jgi:hypothetical protein
MRADIIGLGLALVLGCSTIAAASPISWQYTFLVHGTALDLTSPHPTVTIPNATQLTITINNFDTDTPSGCPASTTSGTYFIPSITIQFMGVEYSAYGGIEINTVITTCVGVGGGSTGLRLFLSPAPVHIDPGGTPVLWIPGAQGNWFLSVPPSEWLGAAYPSGLAPNNGSGGGSYFAGPFDPQFVFESASGPTLVPEPSTWLLLGTGVVALAARRRHTKRVRCQ